MYYLSFLAATVCSAILASAQISQSSTGSCTCTPGNIPVDVDVHIAVDPSDGKFLNSTTLRRQRTTFNVFGTLCQPAKTTHTSVPIQLLLHGQTYTHIYWDVPWNNYQNYSYIDYSCSQGISSFAYDNICAGKSSQPANSSECQIPSAAAVASSLAQKLKDGSLAQAFTGVRQSFTKVLGIGHSLGSSTLNYGAIVDGHKSPFVGFILTGSVHDPAFINGAITNLSLPAQGIDPARWSNLDPGYVTSPSMQARSLFYPPPGGFDPTILQLDFLTEDVGSRWISVQIKNIYAPTQFKGPVTLMIGEFDGTHCLNNNNTPCEQASVQKSEKPFFPRAHLNSIVFKGQGHDLNYGYAAASVFSQMVATFRSITK